MNQTILILDFGSQYTQLIARRIRELSVYSEIHPYNKIPKLGSNIKGIILSGSPFSVLDEDAPNIDIDSLRNRYPILGICYGAQYLSHNLGGKVEKSTVREYGRANLSYIDKNSVLFKNVDLNSQVWMSHADTITQVPDSFSIIASTADVKVAAYKINNENTFGLQFHPEVYHSTDGKAILQNFVLDVCGCAQTWTPKSYISEMVSKIKTTVGDQNVILGLSGGVDSTVCAVLLHKAIGEQLHCIFIDNGLLRKNEFSSVLDSYKGMGLNVKGVDAGNKFLTALKGISDPEAKRKAIGRTFIEVFDEEAKKIDNANWLAQGTIYPDVIESVSVKGPSVSIKSHHNVGGLPDYMKLKLVEPLRMLFKDEVRKIGTELNIDPNILNRHPFPGPGLGIRILGDITADKVRIIQEADYIFIDLLKKRGLYEKVWQAAAILLPIKSVGVMGDERTYENVVALRAVTSTDGMTADWYHLPYDFLADVSNLIINKVKGINRVVYDISSKPPATIEWE
ncbi:MAG: glutamine-hydrolyzing GMP synthase [Lentimicrobiaceae bacterium]|nr:glutamine-hydrolyzing GMP synthase [Lentimicrobiaceae bacterium]